MVMAKLPGNVRWAPETPETPEALDGPAPPHGVRQVVVRYQHGLDPRGVFLAVGVLLGGIVLLFVLQAIIGPLIFIAITIAVAEALRPPVELLHRRGIGRGPAVLLVYGVIAAILFLLVSWLLAPFLAQAGSLIRDIPTYSGRLQSEISRLQTLMRDQHVPSALSDQIGAFAGRLLHTVIALPQQIFNVFVTGLVMAFLVFFWLTSTPQLKGLLLSITSPRLHKTLLELLGEESRVLGGWLQGSLINMALLGTTMAVALFLLGVPYALLLGIFAALTQIIPYVGPWISGVPTIGLAYLTSGPTHAVWVLVVFVLVPEVSSIVFTPLVIHSTVRLHPFVVTCAFLIGGALFGFPGIVLAVPLAAALQVPVMRLLLPALQRRAYGGERGERTEAATETIKTDVTDVPRHAAAHSNS